MTKDEALRLALEALELAHPRFGIATEKHKQAITAIKAALEAKDEPIEFFDWYDNAHWGNEDFKEGLHRAWNAAIKYTAKTNQEAKDEPVAHSVVAGALFDFMGWLTSREKRLILSSVDEASPAVEAITEFAKKRNLSLKYAEVGYWMEFLSTPPQQEAKDEPVAWMYEVNHAHTCLDLFEPPDDAYDEGTLYPLYTTPPQRKPLTDEEIDQICGDVGYGYINVARAIEAAHGIKGEA